MKKILSFLVSREARKYLYSLLIAFVPIALLNGWMEPEAAPLVVGFVVALLNLTPEAPEYPVEKEDEITAVFNVED